MAEGRGAIGTFRQISMIFRRAQILALSPQAGIDRGDEIIAIRRTMNLAFLRRLARSCANFAWHQT
jgi:hypothetical protein